MENKKQNKILMKKEYLVEEIGSLSKEELDKICSEPGWVGYRGKIFKVSEEEYQKIGEDYKARNPDD